MKLVSVAVVLVVVLACGAIPALAQENEPQPRNPLLLGIASFVIPGLGQFFQGDSEKALTHFGVAVLIPLAGRYLAIASPVPSLVWTVVALAHLGWATYSAIDSYNMAVEYNKEHGFAMSPDRTLAFR